MTQHGDRPEQGTELLASGGGLEAFFESASEPMGLIDLARGTSRVNPAWLRTFGPLEPRPADPFGRVYPDDRERVHRAWEEFRAHLDRTELEFRYRTEDGRFAYIHVSTRKITSDGIPLVCVTAHDISKRKKAEAALRDSEERFRRLTENAYDVIAETDEKGRFVYLSPHFGDISGYRREELLGRSAFELVHPDDREKLAVSFQERLEGGSTKQPIFRTRHRDGTWRWVESTSKVYRTESGEQRAVIISRDVSERIRSQEDLRLANERLRTILANAPVFILAIDGLGVVNLCEGGSLGIAGIEPSRLVGQPASSLFAELPQLRRVFRTVLSGEEVAASLEAHDRVLEIRSIPVRGSKDRFEGAIVVGTDVTDRVRAEEASKRLESQVQQSQKLESLGVLAGGIAHDFNNLLTSILGHADLVLADLPPESPARGSGERIREASLRAVDLTNQMLAYAGQGRVEIQALDLSRLVNTIVHLLKVSISKNSELRCELAEDLPAVEGDAGQLTQVALNLITNASEALANKSGVITVRTGAVTVDAEYLSRTFLHEPLPEGSYIYLEVSDTGGGMSEETVRKIFDPFFSTKFTGRGLGLAVLLGIVRAHHGAISVESEQERGSTFRVLFPSSSLPVREAADTASSRTPWEGVGTVLVVDDEAEVRDVVKEMAPRFGLAVMTARNGREALKLFSACADEISAVLLDMTMPEMNGEETFQELLRIRPEVPVILMTGYSEEYAHERFPAGGGVQFLKKPFTIESLRETLRDLLGQSSPS